MYNIIIALIASIKHMAAEYSADALSRLNELEKIADNYESYNRKDTRYSDMANIDRITDSLIIDIQYNFYTDGGIYDKSSAVMAINTVYDIFTAFSNWTYEMSNNSHSVSDWNT